MSWLELEDIKSSEIDRFEIINSYLSLVGDDELLIRHHLIFDLTSRSH